MPADKFTKKANTPKKKREWMHVYENEMAMGKDKGMAIKMASGVLKKQSVKKKKKRKK